MEFKKIEETVFIKDLSTHAYILEGGDIWMQLEPGKCYNQEAYIKSELAKKDNFILILGIFEELDKYYKSHLDKYEIKPEIRTRRNRKNKG